MTDQPDDVEPGATAKPGGPKGHGEAGPTPAAVILPHERNSRADGPAAQRAADAPAANRAAEARLAEAVGLAASIGLTIVHTAIHPLRTRRPSTLLGEGQVAMAKEAIARHGVAVAVVDAALSPVQQRNLERVGSPGTELEFAL